MCSLAQPTDSSEMSPRIGELDVGGAPGEGRSRHPSTTALSGDQLLPNAWDPMSARVLVAAGFDALATTSGGVAWALRYADGVQTPWTDCYSTHRAGRARTRDCRYRSEQRRHPGAVTK